ADTVQQDAAIARGLLAWRPGLLAPLELRDQVVVAVLLLRNEAAEHLAGHVDHTVMNGEYFLRIVVLAVAFEPGVEVGQVRAVEQADGAGLCVRRRRRGRT